MRSRPHATRLVAAVAMLVGGNCAQGAGVVLDEPFDGPTPTWQVRPDGRVRVMAQLRTRAQRVHQPTTAERVVLTCPAGYAAHVSHPVGPLPVLDELSIEVVVRANRPGLQIAAAVVFPRSLDPVTGKPLKALVHGLRYSQPGQWQALKVDKVPLLATRQARFMSVDPRQQVDGREAFVDQVVLLLPGGPDESLVEIDQMTIFGVATDQPTTAASTATAETGGSDMEGPLLQAPALAADKQTQSFEPVEIRRRGSTLSVAGVPLMPRVLECRGEPFDMVAELGFNAVWLAELPTEAQLHAARAARLWVICPPPPMERLRSIAPDSVWQTVLAWSMGLDCDIFALDGLASSVEEIRRADPLMRPLLVGATDRPRSFGQFADVLVRAEPQPLDGLPPTTLHSALDIMGCSPWAQLSLGWSPAATRQTQLLVPTANHLGWHDPHRIRHWALEAIAGGTRGLLVRTPERLTRTSPEARRLADQLQLLNQELVLVEPWLVAGKRLPSAELTGADVTTTAWQLGQSRLVYVPQQTRATRGAVASTLAVAGVPETARAHLFSPAGLLPLGGTRVAGGYRVQLGSIAAGGLILLTDDARALAAAQQRLGRYASRYAQTERDLAVADVSHLESVRSQLLDTRDTAQATRMAAIKRGVQQVDQLMAARDYPSVVQVARQIRYDAGIEMLLIGGQSPSTGFTSVPTQFQARLLPTHQALEQSLRGLARGPNVLAGGDFEDLHSTKSGGWIHANYAEAKLDTEVEFTPQQPYHGKSCLRLRARATGAQVVLDALEPKPVVWITSPAVTMRPGSVIEITGWTRVATQLAEQRGELLVVDNLGGEQLAVRVPATTGWQPFRMVRTIDDSGFVQVNLALNGPASADVDAVMIREVMRPQRTASKVGQ
jgi:hypothetical protein